MKKQRKIVLAYSGGLDTSIILKWLQEKYNAKVIAFTANIGQKINKKKIIKNAKKLGVKTIVIENLKDLFVKDELLDVYTEELANILKSIDLNEIPENYKELVIQNQNINLTKKIKFDNDILHRSKIIKHFLDNNTKLSRTEKDFKSVSEKRAKQGGRTVQGPKKFKPQFNQHNSATHRPTGQQNNRWPKPHNNNYGGRPYQQRPNSGYSGANTRPNNSYANRGNYSTRGASRGTHRGQWRGRGSYRGRSSTTNRGRY